MTEEKSIYAGMYSSAQFQAQVATTILPLGAAAVGFIAQQKYSGTWLISLSLAWTGLFIIAISVVFNLQVVRTNPNTSGGRDAFDKYYRWALISFVVGCLFLITSPVGFVIAQITAPSNIVLRTSTETVKLKLPVDAPLVTSIVIAAQGVPENRFSLLEIKPSVSSSPCLSIVKMGEQIPKSASDVWLTSWKISASTKCEPGDYVILFRIWEENELSGHTSVYVKISP